MTSFDIGIFTANLNSGNMGCNALSYSALMLLDEVGRRVGKPFRYTLFCKDSGECLAHYEELEAFDIHFVPPIAGTRDRIKALRKRSSRLYPDFKHAVEGCDLFFEIAAGDSYSDIYGIARPVFYDKCHSMVMKRGAPLVFLPQTIGPFKSEKAKAIASRGLSYASHIFARDPISHRQASEFAEVDKISQTIDMAFFMDYEKGEKVGGKPRIGINPSGLLWNGGYTGNNQFGLKADFQDLVSKLIESIDPDRYDIVLVPHVLHGPVYHVEDDNKVCRWLKKKYPFCEIAPFFYTPVEAKSFVSGLDLLIGARMHCCIAAYSSGVPVYPLAYSRKFKGLFKEELDYPYGAELVSEDVETIVGGLENILYKLDDIQADMPERLGRVAAYKEGLLQTLSDLISASVAT